MDKPQRLKRVDVHRGHVIAVTVDTVALPNGRQVELDMVHHPGAAAVVPIDAKGQIILVRQYRYATGDWLLEVPAGKLDAGETPEACARRELTEETGMVAGKLVSLGSIYTSPGFCNEVIHLYLGTELTQDKQHLDEDEVLTVHAMPFAEAVRLAIKGGITDSKSVNAILRAHFAYVP